MNPPFLTAAQAAHTNPLSDEYVNAVIQQHGYDSPECVIARLHQWIGLHGGENGLTLLMYEAHKALSKLRAPVADICIGVSATGQGATICIMQPHADGSTTTIYSEMHPLGDSMGRASLASAPVAIPGNTLTGDGSGVALPVAGEAFMYGVMGPDGKAYLDEFCVSADPAELEQEVVTPMNEDQGEGKYAVVALFRDAAPQASGPITHYEAGRPNGDGTYEAVPVRAAPQASEAVRILFPTHLRKMWSGGEVQAWLDERQGVTAPKPSAKGSLERYRKWQTERDEAFAAGVKAAADLVKKMVDAYDTDHGSTDPETGTREYPGEGAAWVCEMQELEESIRALPAQPATRPANSSPSPAASPRQASVSGKPETGNSHTDGGAVYR